MSDKKTDYMCKSTQNIREASLLIEDGYEYVTDIGGTKLFRKRNQMSASELEAKS